MILGLVQRALRQADVPPEVVAEFRRQATSGDYNQLLVTAMRWVNCR